MRNQYLSRSIFVFAAVLVFSTLVTAQSKGPARHALTFDSFGPVKIGMTMSQASKALGVRVSRDAGYDANSCYYASPKRGYRDVSFMMSGQRIVRIDIDTKSFATDRGLTIGDTEAKVKRLYKGMFSTSPHQYVDGHYIEVKKKGVRNRIVFETDGKRVTRFRAGRSPEVGYVEGCS